MITVAKHFLLPKTLHLSRCNSKDTCSLQELNRMYYLQARSPRNLEPTLYESLGAKMNTPSHFLQKGRWQFLFPMISHTSPFQCSLPFLKIQVCIFMCLGVLTAYMHHVHAWHPQRSKTVLDPLGLELQRAVSSYVSPGNRAQVLWK